MTLNKLASAIAKREGKRSQARIGDIREILKILTQLEFEAHLAAGKGEPYYSPVGIIVEAAYKKFNKPTRKARGG